MPTPKNTTNGKSQNLLPLIEQLLIQIGEDPTREGLKKTPKRVANSLQELTSGYAKNPKTVFQDALFSEQTTGVVLVRNIHFSSLCEHHLLPFFGVVHVGYLPNQKIVGLSKIPRLIDILSKRLQIQERLGEQIAQIMFEELEPQGVFVFIEADHLCMKIRGVEQSNAITNSISVRGCFADEVKRNELLTLLRQ